MAHFSRLRICAKVVTKMPMAGQWNAVNGDRGTEVPTVQASMDHDHQLAAFYGATD